MIEYTKFMSDVSSFRVQTFLSDMRRRLVSDPDGYVPMSSGMPDPLIFPLIEGSFTMAGGGTLHLTPQLMRIALQYGATQGYAVLLGQLRDLVKRVHAPPNLDSREVVITIGVQHGLSMCINFLINPGDSVYMVDPTYSGVFPMLRTARARLVGVPSDDDGMIPSSLSAAVASSAGPSKFIYLNPNGSNPEGKTMSEARQRQIYDIASEYDLLIIEDDPYYFFNFSEENPCSFLSLDTEGRVIRLDSMSKIMSAGLRIGFTTALKPFADAMMGEISQTVFHPPMISQVLVSEVLKAWGHQGFMDQAERWKLVYRTRRDAMIAAARKHLTGLCEWREPSGGMFLWMKVLGIEDTMNLVVEQCIPRKLLVAAGSLFLTGENVSSPYIRISYSPIAIKDMDKGCKILAEAIRAELKSSEAK